MQYKQVVHALIASLGLVAVLHCPVTWAEPANQRTDQNPLPETVAVEEEEQIQPVEDVPIEDIQRFVNVFLSVKDNYVEQVSNQQLFENAMQGLVEHLDPYSHYLSRERYQQLLRFTEGQVARPEFNVGFDPASKQWQIQNLSPKSEYYKTGLRNGMLVERIDGLRVQDLEERRVKTLLLGMLGTSVKLYVREGEQIHILDVLRTEKQSYAVEPFLTDEKILVLKIKAFQQDTTSQVQTFVRTYQSQADVKGLLIDLQDNPGGLLSAAVDLAGLFLEKGLIVSTKSRIEADQQFQAFSSQDPISLPIAILQNRYSASAAEVFSAALKENQRAIVLGETSYGKGAIQKLFPLAQGDALQLTVAHYYTPKGHLIDGKGIEPNIALNMQQSEKQRQDAAVLAFVQSLKR